jgi:hypothetical protein
MKYEIGDIMAKTNIFPSPSSSFQENTKQADTK